MKTIRAVVLASALATSLGLFVACGGDDASPAQEAAAGSGGSSAGASGAGGSAGSAAATDCASATTAVEKTVCAAEAFTATLTEAQKTTVQYDFANAAAKTRWSNLPGASRNGVKLGELSDTSRAAALAVPRALLSDAGYADLIGVLAADDYLGTLSSGGGMGGPGGAGQYSSDNYYIAFIGTPSTTGNWMLQFGGHHMAYNISFVAGVGYPVPNHLGAEPKTTFTIESASYSPVTDEGTAMVSLFQALDTTQLSAAYLSGQTFADVLIGPVEYEKGTYASSSFPAGENRKGVLASTLDASQQALLTAAIEQWVRDYDPAIADSLMAAYTSADALADTRIAWGGTEAKGVDPEVNGTYLRIDGPRVWIEVSCQAGVVVQNATHYHTIYRDKTYDYGAAL